MSSSPIFVPGLDPPDNLKGATSLSWFNANLTISGPRTALTGIPGVYEQIVAAANRRTSEPALMHGDVIVTYEELMYRIDDLRGKFVSLGTTPGSAIVVQLPRGIDYIVTILATLAQGCHFVPIAETEPVERVSHIIRQVDALAHVRLSTSGQYTISRVRATHRLRRETSTLAYIMHTSGTTGLPKGAAIQHAALRNLLSWYGEWLSVTHESRFAHLSRPSFDFSIPEILLPLIHGAQVIIPPRTIATGLVPVTEYLIERGVTVLQLVPTLLRPFVNLLASVPGMASRLQSVRTIVCNGETLPDSLRQDVAQILPAAELVNSYGPTEACVAVTWHQCSRKQLVLPNIIGRPAPNVELYVVSDDLRPVPTGAVGELWIGGIQVAEGYAGAPVETQRSFAVRNGRSLSSQNTDRVYRTGDLVRLLSDGNLEFIGRRDRQVQLRGVRVEVDEIEATIRGTALCDEVRVVALPGVDDSTAHALVCFVTPATVDTAELLARVRSRLPEDRRPSHFHPVSEFPMTPNGKMDDAALLEIARFLVKPTGMSGNSREHSSGDARPTSSLRPAERALREVIAALIGRLPYEHELLYELGLDSLGHVELQVALADRGYVLPERLSLEREATIRQVAAHMSRTERAQTRTLGKTTHRGRSSAALKRNLRRLFDEVGRDSTNLAVVQSSLPDFKEIPVYDALSALLSEIDRLAKRITVALPAYTLSFITERRINLRADPSESGMASTHVARALGGLRTRHPVYSFVVIGTDAPGLAKIDWAERSAFGDDSIFGWFSARKTQYVMLGTRALVHSHRCEYLAKVPYQSFTYVDGFITDDTGTRQGGAYVYARDVPGTVDAQLLGTDTNRLFELAAEAVTSRDLGICEAAVIDVRTLEQTLFSKLHRDPYALLKAEMRGQAKALVQKREPGKYQQAHTRSDHAREESAADGYPGSRYQ